MPPASIKKIEKKPAKITEQCPEIKVYGNIPTKQKIFFAKHLSIMTNAGIPLRESLDVIRGQTKIKRFAKILDYVICEVENGQYLSLALSKFPKIFDNLFVNLVRVGEESGQLSENLNYISVQIERADTLRKKVRGALIYPAIILAGVFGITGFLCFVTLPQLLPIFISLKVSLPPTTQFLFDFSHFVSSNVVYIGLIIAALIISIRLLLLNKKFRYFLHKTELMIPVFGPLLRDAQITRLAQVLATLLDAGVDVVRALNITSQSLSNLVFQRELLAIANEVSRQGVNIADCLNTKYFPPIVIQMIRVGEKTGKLDDSFRYISDFLTKEIDDTVNNMTTIIEPVLLLIMGLVVGFVAVSVITPIYKITEGIHR